MLYYPCVIDLKLGRISKIVGNKMTRDKAIECLKEHHYDSWRIGEAIPQPVDHPYFKSVEKCSQCHQSTYHHKMDCSYR